MAIAQNNEVRYLIMVDPVSNHNKYYRMIPHGSIFSVEYGRVGATGMKRDYPMSSWNAKYDEKLNKGYQDQTELHQDIVDTVEDDKYHPISDLSVKRIVNFMREWANEKIRKSYTVKTANVTDVMIEEAQNKINGLVYTRNIDSFNNILCELFSVLPRKMKNVKDYLAKSQEDFQKIISSEQDLLDVMKGQVNQIAVSKTTHSNTSDDTILDIMGIEIRPCNDTEIKTIKEHLTAESESLFKNAWRVENKKTEAAFNKYCKEKHIKNIKYLYHGSVNENFWSIITRGLSLNPHAVTNGKMFGYGLYFANRAKKSIGYSSLPDAYWARNNEKSSTALLAVYKTAVGNSYDVYCHTSEYLSYRESDIVSKQCDSLFAHAGVSLANDEIIVYNENAATIRFLIELGN